MPYKSAAEAIATNQFLSAKSSSMASQLYVKTSANPPSLTESDGSSFPSPILQDSGLLGSISDGGEQPNQGQGQVKRIDILPDDVLLEIFDFFIIPSLSFGSKTKVEEWQSLVHVCRQWRYLVFGSPRRLNLRLFCTPQTPVRDTLDVWPALPLIIWGETTQATGMTLSSGTDNIVAALGQSNRICQINLILNSGQLEEILAPMQVSFPELILLRLSPNSETRAIIPDSFLNGSAPSLRFFYLDGFSFPGVPKLLSSATHLTTLWLSSIPHSGYISPEAIVELISALSNLRTLVLEFESPQFRPLAESSSLYPPKRSILPALTTLQFQGVNEYLEELVTHIDAAQLDKMEVCFFIRVDFACTRLAQFINRTPKLRTPEEAHVEFDDITASVKLRYWTSDDNSDDLRIDILCGEQDWQISSIEQVCDSSLHPLSTVENLYIEHHYSELVWRDDTIGNTLWLRLLLPFIAVKNLYLSKEFGPCIATALQELVDGRITEVLPSLQNIFVEALEPTGHFREKIAPFVTARQLSDRPVAISDWEEDF